MSSLAKAILISLPRGKTVEEIAKETGVDESIVTEKVQNLNAGGFLTEGGKLTQKGYEATQSPGDFEPSSNGNTKPCIKCGRELNVKAAFCPYCKTWQTS